MDPYGEFAWVSVAPVLGGSGPVGWGTAVVVAVGITIYVGYRAWQEQHVYYQSDSSSKDSNRSEDAKKEKSEVCKPQDDYPTNPDEWNPPEGWRETSAGEHTGGRNRQWEGPNGEWRRWDREGRPGGKERGPHWHDSNRPEEHIPPNR